MTSDRKLDLLQAWSVLEDMRADIELDKIRGESQVAYREGLRLKGIDPSEACVVGDDLIRAVALKAGVALPVHGSVPPHEAVTRPIRTRNLSSPPPPPLSYPVDAPRYRARAWPAIALLVVGAVLAVLVRIMGAARLSPPSQARSATAASSQVDATDDHMSPPAP